MSGGDSPARRPRATSREGAQAGPPSSSSFRGKSAPSPARKLKRANTAHSSSGSATGRSDTGSEGTSSAASTPKGSGRKQSGGHKAVGSDLGLKLKDVLRHKAQAEGLDISEAGWMKVSDALTYVNKFEKQCACHQRLRPHCLPNALC